MAFPPSLSLTTVVAQYTDFISANTGWRYLGGTLALTCDYTLRVPADNTFIGPFTLHAAFDPDTGTATIENVPVSDDANLSAPFDYQVTMDLVGKPRHSFRTAIESSDGDPVNLADKAGTVTPIQGAVYATLNGANVFTALNQFNGPVRITMQDLLNVGFILDQPNESTDTDDADGFQLIYDGEPRIWGNEKINLRLRRSGNEIPFRLYLDPLDGSTPTASGIEIIGMGDVTVVRVGPNGALYAANTDYTDWSEVPIAGGTTVGKYSQATDGVNNRNSLQVMVFDGGRMARARGIVLNANVAGSTDELITQAGSIPAALPLLGMSGTVSARPQREREIPLFSTGAGAQRGIIYPNGSIGILGSSPTGSSTAFLGFDSAEWSLEE